MSFSGPPSVKIMDQSMELMVAIYERTVHCYHRCCEKMFYYESVYSCPCSTPLFRTHARIEYGRFETRKQKYHELIDYWLQRIQEKREWETLMAAEFLLDQGVIVGYTITPSSEPIFLGNDYDPVFFEKPAGEYPFCNQEDWTLEDAPVVGPNQSEVTVLEDSDCEGCDCAWCNDPRVFEPSEFEPIESNFYEQCYKGTVDPTDYPKGSKTRSLVELFRNHPSTQSGHKKPKRKHANKN